MILSLVTTLRQRHALRQTVNALLARSDDHMLEDIGLSRAEVLALLRTNAPTNPAPRIKAPAFA